MGGLKKYFPDVRFGGNLVGPDEIDGYQQYEVIFPGTSLTWVGTVAGTQTQAKAVVLINQNLDYPRNLAYSIAGSADIGGSITVVGKDQFGKTVTETVGSGTVASGNPAFNIAGTRIFSQVTAATVTFATSAGMGNGTAQLGQPSGGTAGSTAYFGLPVKIGAVSDVKRITHLKNFVNTTLNGGTISSTLVGTTYHTFNGTAALGSADVFVVTVKPTYNSENETISGL